MRTLRYITLSLLLALTFQIAQAQQFSKKKRYWSIAMTLDGMNYFGDIVPQNTMTSFDIQFTRPKIGFYGMRRLTPNISFRGGMAYGRLQGDDAISSPKAVDRNSDSRFTNYRNLHFRNDVSELSGMLIFDMKQNRGMFYQRPNGIIPYAFVGLGLVYHNPKARTPLFEGITGQFPDATETETPWSSDPQKGDVGYGEWVALRELQTEGVKYSPLAVSVPFGLGVRYKLSNRVDLAFEIGYRWTFTDYLDDVSTRYIVFDDPNSLAAIMANRSMETVTSNSNIDRTGVIDEMTAHYGGNPAAFSAPRTDTYYGERRGNDGTPYTNPDAKKSLFNGANDVYIVYGFHINYILAMGVQCPKFRR